MTTEQRAVPLLKAVRAEADSVVARACDQLLEEAGEEVREHRSLKVFSKYGAPTLASTGPLGRAVLILYCQSLFVSQAERRKCMRSSLNCVQPEDLEHLATAAAKLRSLDLSPLQDEAVFHILRRVCSTSYFRKEDVKKVSRVLTKLGQIERGHQVLRKLSMDMNRVYKRAGFVHYHGRNGQKLDFDNVKPDQYCLCLDPAELLAAVYKSTALSMLVTKRPPDLILPHVEAASVCIEHAVMWLNARHLNVFYPLNLSYHDLSSTDLSENDLASFLSYWDVRVPSYLDRLVRHSVFTSYIRNRFREDGVAHDQLHYLKPEEFKHPDYLLGCLRQDLTRKQLKVFRNLPFAYRSQPEDLEFNRVATCDKYAGYCKKVMPLEPPQYRHLYV